MSELICDTSVVQYLHQVHLLHILPALGSPVVLPEAVVVELEQGRGWLWNAPTASRFSTIGSNRIPQQTLPIEDGKIHVRLAGLPCGDYSLEAVVRHRETREAVLQATCPISIIDIPAIDRSTIRPLNSLVSELLDQPLQNTPDPQTFSFVNPRDGWIFVACTTEVPAPKLAVTIDGGEPVITATDVPNR